MTEKNVHGKFPGSSGKVVGAFAGFVAMYSFARLSSRSLAASTFSFRQRAARHQRFSPQTPSGQAVPLAMVLRRVSSRSLSEAAWVSATSCSTDAGLLFSAWSIDCPAPNANDTGMSRLNASTNNLDILPIVILPSPQFIFWTIWIVVARIDTG